ncbi:MAG: M50 family metallopeptidase [Kofleriaceae bacterium]
MFHAGSLTLFHVRRIPIRAHWTFFLVVPYLAIAMTYQFKSVAILAGVSPDRLTVPPAAWGLMLAIALFASIAIHELAHAFIAIHFGARVRAITLMLVGGATQMSHPPSRPLHEAAIAVAGPLTSLAIGAACAIGYALAELSPDAQMSLFYLATLNISLGLFNLIPAFPMDGGRILRAGATAKLGRDRATRLAASIGKFCAIALATAAILQLQLLLLLVAVFIYVGAMTESTGDWIATTLDASSIGELVSSRVPVIEANLHLDDAARRMSELERLELVVVDSRGPVAVIEADDISRLRGGHATWPLEALVPHLPARFVVVTETDGANLALETAAQEDARYVVVVRPPAKVLGMVGSRDIEREVKLRHARAAA